jgi:ribosome biogenesis SPOUT family RNA methylase Rps3
MSDHSLDDIVHSIQSAVIAATDIAERHELDSITNQEFWELKLDEKGEPVTGLTADKKKGQLMVRPCATKPSWFKKESNAAKLKLIFKGSEPPEGYARIDDQLIKLLP